MLKDVVSKKKVEAMKSGNKELNIALGMLLAELKNKEIDLRGKKEMDEMSELEVVNKLVKQTDEAIRLTPKDRKETLDKLMFERKVYAEFLPKQMDENEIKENIEKVLSNLGLLGKAEKKNKGMIMKTLMPLVSGKANGKVVNDLVDEYLV